MSPKEKIAVSIQVQIHVRQSADQTESSAETEAGGLTWMMAAMGFPEYSAEIYGYQSVIGTGNLVAAWDPNSVTREIVL